MLSAALTVSSVQAGIIDSVKSAYNFVVEDMKAIIDKHDYDIYVTLYAWHNRLTYDRRHLKRYNEKALGFGVGISHTRENGDWSGFHALGFMDSHNKFETYFGYVYQWNWTFGDEKQWRAGIGYTMGLTQRHEYNYIPLPLVLPLFGVGYRGFNLQAAYVPGGTNDGNVLFVFARYQF